MFQRFIGNGVISKINEVWQQSSANVSDFAALYIKFVTLYRKFFENSGWLTRGYTGHEHVPQVDLINMNGRMYDAVLGRMLSPDKYVQDGTNTQAYNRYSYVMNNPLKYTDPSGWKIKATWGQMAIDADESKSGGGGGSRYIGGLDLTGSGNIFNSWGTTMLSGMFYAPSQQYYINPVTGSYMFGNQVIDRKDYINGTSKNTGYWSKAVVNKTYAVPDKEATEGFGAVFVEQTEYYYNSVDNSNGDDYTSSSMYPVIGPMVGFISSVVSGLEIHYGNELENITATIANRGKILGATKSLRTAKAAAEFGTETAEFLGNKVFAPVSFLISGYDFIKADNGWDRARAGCDFLMTFVGISCPVAGLVYFGVTLTYDIYIMSKKP